MSRWSAASALVLLMILSAPPASAHSYADPALRTVFDGVQPTSLPAGVGVAVVPSVVDELVLTNTTAQLLEVTATGGEPFLRLSRAGVLANLASPDWYATGNPEGGTPPPADVLRDRGKGAPRWQLVSRGHTWAEFDARLHPAVTATAAMRAEGRDRVLATWRIPLTYAGQHLAATGHVLFSPVRGGLITAVTRSPSGATATALQGELPGLFVQVPTGHRLDVQGSDGQPFLRFAEGTVSANTASASWADDQRAKGRPVPASGGRPLWRVVGAGSFSWLDPRLRYPSDQPPADQLDRTTVVKRWSIPVSADGHLAAIAGTVTWVPRSAAIRQLSAPSHGTPWWRWSLVGAAVVSTLVAAVTWRRRR